MKEKVLTVLVVASLILSVFNLVLMLRTNGINTITNITEPTTTPTAEVYAVNMTRTVLTNDYYQITGYTYDFAIVNPTTKTVPCVISVTLSNGTVSQSYVLTYQEYQFYLQIFTIPPQSSIQYSNYAQFGGDPLQLDINCTTAQITIFDLLNGAIGQQTLAIQQPSYTSPTGQAGGTEQGQVTNLQFSANTGSILVTFNNTGTSAITINQIWVNNVQVPTADVVGAPVALNAAVPANSGTQYTLTMTSGIVSGSSYSVTLVSAKGNKFTSTGTAPS